MKVRRFAFAFLVAGLVAHQLSCTTAQGAVSQQEAVAIATDAYVYAYPLVTMEMTRRVSTNVAKPEGSRAPMGQFARLREYPTAAFREVTAPNADTLYTVVWLDVGKEPWVITVPAMSGRYFLLPLLDGWTTVFEAPGTRTTGDGAQKFAITGPGWRGKLPAGVTEYKSPTSIVWLLGRIYCTGTPEDYKAVHALQDQMSAVPLSSYGKPYTPPPSPVDPAVDMTTPVRNQVNRMDGTSYFKLFAQLLKTNPPRPEDAPMVAKLATIGIVPGKDLDVSKLDPTVAAALQSVPKVAQAKIVGWLKNGVVAGDATLQNGWSFTTKTGTYGTNYLQRALVTVIGLGANRPQDAIYPISDMDADGKAYDGANKYVMHFDKGQLPPARAFWSLTMYDAAYFFVANPLNRYNVSSRTKFATNADGSIDVYLQNESPGPEKEANWLPAPTGKFVLMLRMYYPRTENPSILNNTWKIPPDLEDSTSRESEVDDIHRPVSGSALWAAIFRHPTSAWRMSS